MTEQDKADLARFRERERSDLIDNLYRARVLDSYVDVEFSTEQLKDLWHDYIAKAQLIAWNKS